MPRLEIDKFSVHIEQADTLQVAHLIVSYLSQDADYRYVPGWSRGGGSPTTTTTHTERYKDVRSERFWYRGDREHIFEVRNSDGTDEYEILFRELEPEMATMIGREFFRAFPRTVEPARSPYMQTFGGR